MEEKGEQVDVAGIRRIKLWMMEDSSSDDDNATIGSMLKIKKVKTTLYMTNSHATTNPDQVLSEVDKSSKAHHDVFPMK